MAQQSDRGGVSLFYAAQSTQIAKKTRNFKDMKRGADENEKTQVRGMRELERFAQQTGRSVQTVNEKHQEQLERLKAAYDANLITAEQYGRAVLQANEQAANSYDVVAEKVERVGGGVADVDDKQQSAGRSTEGLGGAVSKAVLSYLSFNAVLSKVGEALQWTRQQVEEAKASFEGMDDPRRRLAQIADPAVTGRSLDELESRVDELAARYGEQREKVAGALFSAVSEGFEDALESLVRYGDVVDLSAAAGVAGQVPTLFGGQIGAEESVSTTLLAARQSRLSFEEIATAMPTIAEGAALADASPTEAMGVLSVMAGTFKSGEQAAQRFKALATRFAISDTIGGVSADERAAAEQQISGSQGRMEQIEAERTQKQLDLGRRREETQERERRLLLRRSTFGPDGDRAAVDFDLARIQRELTEDLPAAQIAADRQADERRQAEQDRIAAAQQTLAAPEGVSLAGRGIVGGVEALMEMDEASRREFLGNRQELNVAYQTLAANLPAVRERIEELNDELATLRAGGEGTLERQYQQFFQADTDQGQRRLASEEKRQAEVRREIMRERQLATGGFETQAARDRVLAEMSERGEATFGQFAVERTGQAAELMGASEDVAGGTTEAARRYFGGTASNTEFMLRNVYDAVMPLNLLLRLASSSGGDSASGAPSGAPQYDDSAMLEESRRQTELLSNIAAAGPRSGLSTMSQPQMSAQTIPR